MIYIRTILFKILFLLATFLSPVVLLPFSKSFKGMRVCQYTYALFTRIALRISLGAKVEYRGLENLPKDKPVIIIGKHQSSLETILLPGFFNRPAFIMKKELLKIPVLGTWMKNSGQIPIDRDGGMKTLKLINQKAKDVLAENRVVVIFPEGTRSAVGSGRAYSVGAYFLAKEFPQASVIPMALNTGCVWKNKSFLNGTGKKRYR